MKKFTLLMSFILLLSWQGMTQTTLYLTTLQIQPQDDFQTNLKDKQEKEALKFLLTLYMEAFQNKDFPKIKSLFQQGFSMRR